MTRAAVKGLVVFLAVILFGTFTYFCVLVYNREEEMLAARAGLVFAKNEREIEAVLGAPIKVSKKFISIHSSHSSGVFTQKDENDGYVFKLYTYWAPVSFFHGSYRTMAAKIRPSDGAVMAVKIVVE